MNLYAKQSDIHDDTYTIRKQPTARIPTQLKGLSYVLLMFPRLREAEPKPSSLTDQRIKKTWYLLCVF
jgi:hypothetical protein